MPYNEVNYEKKIYTAKVNNSTDITKTFIYVVPLGIQISKGLGLLCLMPLSTIFRLYSVGQFIFVEETRVPGKNHRPVVSHWQISKGEGCDPISPI
jgi:hypothetical protein